MTKGCRPHTHTHTHIMNTAGSSADAANTSATNDGFDVAAASATAAAAVAAADDDQLPFCFRRVSTIEYCRHSDMHK